MSETFRSFKKNYSDLKKNCGSYKTDYNFPHLIFDNWRGGSKFLKRSKINFWHFLIGGRLGHWMYSFFWNLFFSLWTGTLLRFLKKTVGPVGQTDYNFLHLILDNWRWVGEGGSKFKKRSKINSKDTFWLEVVLATEYILFLKLVFSLWIS